MEERTGEKEKGQLPQGVTGPIHPAKEFMNKNTVSDRPKDVNKKIDFSEINRQLLGNARSILFQWFPNGTIKGGNFCIGNLQGAPGDSLSINLEKGFWKDFNRGDKGGDLISLYAAINGMKQIDAARALSTGEYQAMRPKFQEKKAVEEKHNKNSIMFMLPPEDSMPPSQGKECILYRYRNKEGQTVFFIQRIDFINKKGEPKKDFKPWSYSNNHWVMKGWPGNKPLYGAELLHRDKKKPVLVVEGEKACEAARKFMEDKYIVVTWSNGSGSVNKTDWKQLYRRQVLIWPDPDVGGEKSANEIIKILSNSPTTEIKKIDVHNDPEIPDKWDAADSGFKTFDEWFAWANPLIVRPSPNINDEDMVEERRVQQQSWESLGITLNDNMKPIVDELTILNILRNHDQYKGKVKFDEFHQRILINGEKITNKDRRDVHKFILGTIRLRKTPEKFVHTGLNMYAEENMGNILQETIQSYQYNNEHILEDFFFLIYGATDDGNEEKRKYIRAIGKNFWIMLVARIFDPGCKADYMLILRGPQGIGKSMSLQEIAGREYYMKTQKNLNDSTETAMSLVGKTIFEMGELASMKKANIETIKNFLDVGADDFRPKYEKEQEQKRRTCIVVGTTNDNIILKDQTGNRRFWIIDVTKVNMDLLKKMIPRLYAEALHRFKAGESWWNVPSYAEVIQEASRAVDPKAELIRGYLQIQKNLYDKGDRRIINDSIQRDDKLEFVTIGEIITGALKIREGDQHRGHSRKVGELLKNELGINYKPIYISRKQQQCVNLNEIKIIPNITNAKYDKKNGNIVHGNFKKEPTN